MQYPKTLDVPAKWFIFGKVTVVLQLYLIWATAQIS